MIGGVLSQLMFVKQSAWRGEGGLQWNLGTWLLDLMGDKAKG